jgi:ubiquinone/menaquinone biosynthesis C-methylase UbiE
LTDQRPRSEFNDVDHAEYPAEYLQMLDSQRSVPFIQQYKHHVRDLHDLRPGQKVLDAGTGTGEDARDVAALVAPGGEVIGLDFSQLMIDEALRRSAGTSLPLRLVQGDIQHLPFSDNTFDRCYADRVFIHLPDPARALEELVRTTKPGGLVLVAESDHESQVLDNPYPDVTRRFFRFRNDGMRHPGVAHRRYALFQDAGVTDIRVEPIPRVTTDYELLRPVAHYAEGMRTAERWGAVTSQEGGAWILALEQAIQTGRFFHAMLWFIIWGRKPE